MVHALSASFHYHGLNPYVRRYSVAQMVSDQDQKLMSIASRQLTTAGTFL